MPKATTKTSDVGEKDIPSTKCYKFNGNWSIGGIVYHKGDCIHLTVDQYEEFKPYVYECLGHKHSGKGPCKRC